MRTGRPVLLTLARPLRAWDARAPWVADARAALATFFRTRDAARLGAARVVFFFVVLTARFVVLAARFVVLAARFVVLVARFVTLVARFVALVARFVALVARFVALVARFVALVARFVAFFFVFRAVLRLDAIFFPSRGLIRLAGEYASRVPIGASAGQPSPVGVETDSGTAWTRPIRIRSDPKQLRNRVCLIDHCDNGFLDVDRTDANGCELTSPIPTDGLVLWLAADEGLEESAGKVTAWRDRSSKRYDHTQPNSSVQPTVLAAKLNGRPVVDFQKQRLENGDFSDTFTEGFSLFTVVERDTSTGPPYEYGAVLDLFDNERTNGLYFARYGGGNDFLAGYANVSGQLYTTGNPFAPDVPHLVALTLGSSGSTLRWDGQEPPAVVTDFTPTPLFLERSYIGGNSSTLEFQDGYIAEIILYDRAITEGQAVEQYLTAKWGCCPDPG